MPVNWASTSVQFLASIMLTCFGVFFNQELCTYFHILRSWAISTAWGLFVRVLLQGLVTCPLASTCLPPAVSLCSCWPQLPSVLSYSDSPWQLSFLQFLPQGRQSHWICGTTLCDTVLNSPIRTIIPPLSLPFMRSLLRDPSAPLMAAGLWWGIVRLYFVISSVFSYLLLILPQSLRM